MILLNGNKMSIYKIRSYMLFHPGYISNYDVDFHRETINITYNLVLNEYKDYGIYQKLINNAFHQVFENYKFHKKENEYMELNSGIKISKTFLDEIQYVGLLYVDKIETKSKADMPELYKINYTKQNVKDDFQQTRSLFRERNLGNFERNRKLPWDLDPEMSQKIPYISALQLLGLFIKEEHKIMICEENIKETLDKITKYNPKLSMTLFKFIELVLLHELGHSVFQYVRKEGPVIDETRANYFSSYIAKGIYDPFIDELTQIQPLNYRFPLLSLLYIVTEQNIHSYSYDEAQRKYNDLVGDLYEI